MDFFVDFVIKLSSFFVVHIQEISRSHFFNCLFVLGDNVWVLFGVALV